MDVSATAGSGIPWRRAALVALTAFIALLALAAFAVGRPQPAGAATPPDYVISTTGPTTAAGGAQIGFGFRVSNQNGDPSGIPLGRRLVVRIVLSPVVSFRFTTGSYFTCAHDGSAAGGVVTCTSTIDARYLENPLSLGVTGLMVPRPSTCTVTSRAIVDATNQIAETNEGNNESVFNVPVVQGCLPDMAVDVRGPATQAPGPIAYTLDLRNIGGTATPPGEPLRARITAQGAITGATASGPTFTCTPVNGWIECVTTTSIAPGALVQLTLTATATYSPSNNQIRVDGLVNSDGRIREDFANNNQDSQTTSVTGPPVTTPAITSFTPASGAVGTAVTIAGINLGGATRVTFNGVSAPINANTATSITTRVPAGATTGRVAVTTPSGTATSAASFTVPSATPAPTISGFTPTGGPANVAVTISGSNFVNVTSVAFNGKPATFTVTSPTQITTRVPGGATSGPLSVVAAGGTATSAGNFTVTPLTPPLLPPDITSFTPTSGPVGTTVVITGTRLTGTKEVAFNGVKATVFQTDSATQVTARVPAGATSGPIRIIAETGSVTSTATFTVTQLAPAPSIGGFTPASGPVGTSVTINGANFTGVSGVTFNGASAQFSVASPTRITATVPAGATSGPIRVVTPGGTATSAGSFTVSAPAAPPPSISSFSPTNGPAGTVVTVNGANFTGATGASVNGSAAQFTVLSATQVRLTVPNGASSGPLRVTTPRGMATSAGSFTVTAPAAAKAALKLYWHAGRGDYFTTATAAGEQSAAAAGYTFVRTEGYVFTTQQPGTVPLKSFWHAGRGDNFTTATAVGEQSAQQAGYSFVRVEGYVYPTQQAGTTALKLYWNGGLQDNASLATSQSENAARGAGYGYVRVEGYVFTNP